jgi:nicotinate-nucleotide adenylyltransferase
MIRMRVAFFGGTFDPIHRGHLAVASAAADAFALDHVVFAPTGRQPLKSEGSVASFNDRLAMAALACVPDKLKQAASGLASDLGPKLPVSWEESKPLFPGIRPTDLRFVVSSLDAPKPDGSPNYTVDTLAELFYAMPQADLFAIAGADSFLTMRKWRSPDRLLELAEWIVVSRPEFPLADVQLAPLALTPAQRARVHLLATVHEDVSATELRRRLRSGDPCPGLLPLAVAEYIQTHNLYR